MSAIAADLRHLRGTAGSRLARHYVVIGVVGGLIGLGGVGAVIAGLHGSPNPGAPCPPTQPACPRPPEPSALARRLTNETQYLDPANRFRFEYPANALKVTQSNGTVTVTPAHSVIPGDSYTLVFQPATGTGTSAQQLGTTRLNTVQSRLSSLAATTDPSQSLLGAEVGFHFGIGGVFDGNASSSQGGGAQVQVTVMSATDGQNTVAMSAAISTTDATLFKELLGLTDHILNSFRFSSEFST